MIYLSGAISDPDPTIQKKNLLAFKKKAQELRKKGWEVFSPPENEPDGKSYEYYLATDLLWIVDNMPESIYMMKGWKSSHGAKLELEMAKLLDIKIIYE